MTTMELVPLWLNGLRSQCCYGGGWGNSKREGLNLGKETKSRKGKNKKKKKKKKKKVYYENLHQNHQSESSLLPCAARMNFHMWTPLPNLYDKIMI